MKQTKGVCEAELRIRLVTDWRNVVWHHEVGRQPPIGIEPDIKRELEIPVYEWLQLYYINTLWPGQNGRHLLDEIFQMPLKENV